MSETIMKNFYMALDVTGKSMLALFAFMLLFFFLLILIQKLFPGEESDPHKPAVK